jgi:hypothetical protein
VYSSARGTWLTRDEIGAFYERLGGPASELGYPTDDVEVDGAGCYQYFENGYVSYLPGKEPIFVPNEVAGWGEGLGAATSALRSLDDGPDCVQFFEKGVVTVVGGVAEKWVRPQV